MADFSRFTQATSLPVWIVSGFFLVIRTMTRSRGEREGYGWPKVVFTTRGIRITGVSIAKGPFFYHTKIYNFIYFIQIYNKLVELYYFL